MLAPILALSFLVPQQARPRPHLPSRNLPAERTLFVVEVPDPQAVAEHAAKVAQLAVFKVPRVRKLVDFAIGQAGIANAPAREDALRRMFLAFDRGLTFAATFPRVSPREGWMPEPHICFIGSASDARLLRDHPKLLRSVVARDSLQVERRPLLDSPVVVEWLHRDAGWEVDWTEKLPVSRQGWDYIADSSVFAAYKGRTAAFAFQSGYTDRLAPLAIVPLVGDVLGIGPKPDARLRPKSEPKPDGWTTLLRARYLPGALRSALSEHAKAQQGMDRINSVMSSIMGVNVFEDVTAAIATDGEEIEERVRIDLVPGKTTVFPALHSQGRSLAGVARHLPSGTIAAAHLRIDGKVISDQLWDLVTEGGGADNELTEFFREARVLLGLGPQPAPAEQQPARVGLDGLRELTFAMVPGAAGSPVPEPVLLVPCERDGAAGEMLARAAALLAGLSPEVSEDDAATKLRTLGKGEDAIRYLRYADFFPDMTGFVVRFLGGGFLSATRVGDRLAIGCNPRTLREIRRADGESSLQHRPDFAESFRAESDAPIEAFVDAARLANEMKIWKEILPWIAAAATSPNLELPRVEDLLPLMKAESFVLRKTDGGWLLVHRGGTLLSPTAWIAVGFTGAAVSALVDLITGS